MTARQDIFRCVHCHAGHVGAGACASCGHDYETIGGIPILVQDKSSIQKQIEAARAAGLAAWYEAEQPEEFVGPYRHHLKKRRSYLDEVIGRFRQARGSATIAGLDLGCGDGAHLRWLSGYVDHLYASDYNPLRLERAAKRNPKTKVFMADVTDYPARDDAFDLLFFNHVLEHIPNDAAALAEVRRILKPGGLLVLGVPNEGAIFWQIAYRLEPHVRRASDHVHFFTGDDLAGRCKAAGLDVQHVEYIGWGVPHWTLDFIVRRYKWIDDGLELIGRRLMQRQATSLYLLCTKT